MHEFEGTGHARGLQVPQRIFFFSFLCCEIALDFLAQPLFCISFSMNFILILIDDLL